MDSNDLFSFLDDSSSHHQNGHPMDQDPPISTGKPSHKRKAHQVPARNVDVELQFNPHNGKKDNDDADMHDSEDNEAGPSAPKKLRTASPNPLVLDDFEEEAKREVAASAGLTGGVEAGSRLELKHQVRCFASHSIIQ